ncbi:MAG: hypothetical protein Q4C75_02170 [Bergeyella zoohelcum]|nr:hypothetical protein [Bergeyella zoohelcum]
MQILIRTFRSLSWRNMMRLCSVWLPHPFFAIMSVFATLKAFSLAQKYYPKTAGSNGKGNAFRHALWCCLIMSYCSKISSPQKALVFCKSITDLHEELFPNEPLERKMDLHNNQIGMDLFMKMLKGIHRQFFENQFFVEELKKKMQTAEPIENIHQSLGNELVYIKEKPIS